MTFNEVMALIMPSIVALLFYMRIFGKKLSYFELVGNLTFFLLVTNGICYAISVFLKKTPSFDMAFTMKYAFMATITSVLFSIVYRFIELNIILRVKVEQTDEKD